MKNDLKKFIESLKRDNNSALIENIIKGYSCIFEGYSDVRDIDTLDATTRFNQQVAYNSSLEGNNILSFLQRSSENLAGKYTIDSEPELDNYPTSMIAGPSYISSDDLDSQVDVSDDYESPQSFENNLGLTAKEMKDLF